MSEVDGVQEFNQRIEQLTLRGRLDRGAHEELGQMIISEMQENFRVGGRPSPWKTSGRVEHFGGQTLRQSGRLMRSLMAEGREAGVDVGSNLIYARIHALGGIIRAKQKPYLVFRVASGLKMSSASGRKFKHPKKQYSLVRVKQVEIPQRDYRYISPRGFELMTSAMIRHLVVAP